MGIKYQLLTPSNHRENNAERDIKSLKNHFIVGLCRVDKDFRIQLWDSLLQKAKEGLNFLRQPIILPHISASTHIIEEFNYNCTPLEPPGKIMVIHNRKNNRASWAPHGEYSWYIGPSTEHYRFHKSYTPKTRPARISDTVKFSPKKFNMTKIYSTHATIHAAQDLIYALHNPAHSSPLLKLGIVKKEALISLA